MGRKTYASIPASFRPLRDRTNIVITSQSRAALDLPQQVRTAASLPDALRQLQEEEQRERTLGRVFVIGGAQVYEQALRMRECERVLWTRVGWGGGQREWVCDTFFPKGVVAGDGDEGEEEDQRREWKRAGQEDIERWIGEEVRPTRAMVNIEDGEGRQEESEVEVELEWSMWVRKGGG